MRAGAIGIGVGFLRGVAGAGVAVQGFTARFGVGADQATGTGAFDTSLYTGSTPANGTYGNFSVTSGVITPNGSQTAGTYDVDGWPVEVISGYKAIANQTQFNAVSGSDAGKTILIREGAAISAATTWNNNVDLGYMTILGDGDDPRLDTSSGRDSRKHFVTWDTYNTKRLIIDSIRLVTGSISGAKVNGMVFTGTGGGGGNYVEDVHIVRSAIIASRPDPFGDYSAGISAFPGSTGIYHTGNGRRMSVRDNYILGSGGDAAIYVIGIEQWAEIVGNWVDMSYLDAVKPPSVPTIYGGNLLTRPMAMDTDAGGVHNDGIQYQGAKGIAEACAFVKGDCRGSWQSFFSQDGETALTIRNIMVADDDLYQISIADPNGSQVANCTWLPRTGASFPLSNPQGGLRFELRFAGSLLGTNDILNSVFRDSSSIIEAGVTETGNIDAQSWVEADWNTNYPNWDITGLPTLQNAIQVHAAPAGGGAAAGKGANQNITSWGSERSSYVLNVTTPTVSSISLTATADGFTGTLRTDVGNNVVHYCVIPQAQGNPTYREIKERRVSNAFGYGLVWCSRANAGTDLAISATGGSASTAYKLVAVAENGWSKQSSVTTANFTTIASGITRVSVGAMASSNSTSSLVMNMPASLANGDYLVSIISHRETTSEPTTPSGWTLIGNGVGFSNSYPTIAVYGRVRDGTEGSTLTVSTGAAGRMLGFVTAYRGASGDGFEATANSFSSGSRATPTGTATADSCILHIWTAEDAPGGIVTLPNAGDLIASGYTPDTTWFLGAENVLSVGAGTTTARTATSSGGPNWNAMQVEILV